MFHKPCITEWSLQNYTCPICRVPIISNTDDINAYKQLAQLNQIGNFEDAIDEGEIIDSQEIENERSDH